MHLQLIIVAICIVISSDIGFAEINTLSHKQGCLRPNFESMEPDATSNDQLKMAKSIKKSKSFSKLEIFFQQDCISTEDEAEGYITSLMSIYPCVSRSTTSRSKNGIYYMPKSDQWMAFLKIPSNTGNGNGNCCIDEVDISYDDYCIAHIAYEPKFYQNKLLDLECINSNRSYAWNLDYLDNNYKDDLYNHPDTLTRIYESQDVNVDIYITDSGVLSTHEQFMYTYGGVVHADPNCGDEDILGSHGTHVAGIAAGYITGVAQGFPIIEYPIFGCDEDGGWQINLDAFEYILDYLLSNPKRRVVINMSWGNGLTRNATNEYLYEPLDMIYEAGGILVAAVGNSFIDACTIYPANSKYVIAVGSGYQGEVSSFSNYGKCVDIYAPGTEIPSSVAFDLETCQASNNSYNIYSGTSMASPMITGVIANMLAFNNKLTFEEIKDILINAPDNVKLDYCVYQEDDDGNPIDCMQFRMNCETMRQQTQLQFNSSSQTENEYEYDCDNFEYILDEYQCDNNPCNCKNDDLNCQVCHSHTGCSQCQSGYFKIDYNHACISCQEAFGENCMLCSDYHGCQQCKQENNKYYDDQCGLYFCE